MARSSAAAARAGASAAPARSPVRRAAPPSRRRSGPAQRTTRRAPSTAPAVVRLVEAGTAGLVDRLVRGRVWVGFVGALLAGIVFLNVTLLQLNQEIARTTVQATALDRQNSVLRNRLSQYDSSERAQHLAATRGMIMPAPSQYRYLTAQPWLDAELAARAASSPGQSAIASTAGVQPASAAGAPTATAPTTTTATAATPAAATATAGTP